MQSCKLNSNKGKLWDGAHHIVPQTATGAATARTITQQCYPGKNQGIHSASNGSILQQWFHASLHTSNAYGNTQDSFCQSKPINIRILAQLQEHGPDPVDAEYTVYRALPGGGRQEVYSDDIKIQPRSDVQEFLIPWFMEDEAGNPLPPGVYIVVLEPKGDGELSPQTTEGITFGLKLIDPNAEAQQRINQINSGHNGDFSLLAFNFQTGSIAAKETLLGMSEGLAFTKTVPFTGGLLGELDLAGNASPTGAPTYQGLGLKIPTQPPFLYGSNFTKELTDGYVSWLTPYRGDSEYISLYDLTGLVYHLYRGQELVSRALENTKCRNPYIHTYLKVMDNSNGVKSIVQNDVNRVTPKINIQNTSLADQNDVIKLIADSPAENRLTFSNALHSLHFPGATSGTTRIVARPGGAGADVKFKDNNKLVFAREHKNAAVSGVTGLPLLLTADYISEHINKALRQTKDDTSLINSKINVFFQTHHKVEQTFVNIQNEILEFSRRRARDKNCKRDYLNFTITIADPNSFLYANEMPVCP
jgi:hypothetical protein